MRARRLAPLLATSALAATVLAGCGLNLPGQNMVVVVNRDDVGYRADVRFADMAATPYLVPPRSTVIVARTPVEATVVVDLRTVDCTGVGGLKLGAGAEGASGRVVVRVIENGAIAPGTEAPPLLMDVAPDGDAVCPPP